MKINIEQIKKIWERIRGKKWYVILGIAVIWAVCHFHFEIDIPGWAWSLVF